MKTIHLIAVLLMLALTTPFIVHAAEGAPGSKEPSKEAKEEDDPIWAIWIKFFAGCDAAIKDTIFEKDDVKPFLDNYQGYTNLVNADVNYMAHVASMKERYDYVSTNEAYKKWAKEKNLDADKWLKKFFRLSIVASRVKNFEPNMVDLKSALDEAKKSLEDMKDSSEDIKKLARDLIANYEKSIKGLQKVIDSIPAPTDAEKNVIESTDEKFVEALDSVMSG